VHRIIGNNEILLKNKTKIYKKNQKSVRRY